MTETMADIRRLQTTRKKDSVIILIPKSIHVERFVDQLGYHGAITKMSIAQAVELREQIINAVENKPPVVKGKEEEQSHNG